MNFLRTTRSFFKIVIATTRWMRVATREGTAKSTMRRRRKTIVSGYLRNEVQRDFWYNPAVSDLLLLAHPLATLAIR